jgi:uncharacterized protein (TIGR02001 family)
VRRQGPWLRWGREGALLVVGLLLASAARAQLGATIAVDSDYRYRGISLSDSKPSGRLTLNYDAPERWYAGASATRAVLTPSESYNQLLGYAGGSTPVGDGRDLELGVDGSYFNGISGYDFAEAFVGLLAERWSARLYLAPDYYGRHVSVVYSELNGHVPLDAQSRLFAHAGALVPVRGATGEADRTRVDLSLGAGLALRGWDLHVALVGASAGGPYPAVYNGRQAAVVLGASYSF